MIRTTRLSTMVLAVCIALACNAVASLPEPGMAGGSALSPEAGWDNQAPVRRLVLNDGRVIDGKLFKGEADRVLILEDSVEPPRITEVKLSEVESADGNRVVSTMIYRPGDWTSRHEIFLKATEDRLEVTDLLTRFNDTDETWEFADIPAPLSMTAILDDFGHQVPYRISGAGGASEGVETRGSCRARLNHPVRPGEDLRLRILETRTGAVVTAKSGVSEVSFDFPSASDSHAVMNLLLPVGSKMVKAEPKPVLSRETSHGTVVVFEKKVHAGERAGFEVSFKAVGN